MELAGHTRVGRSSQFLDPENLNSLNPIKYFMALRGIKENLGILQVVWEVSNYCEYPDSWRGIIGKILYHPVLIAHQQFRYGSL